MITLAVLDGNGRRFGKRKRPSGNVAVRRSIDGSTGLRVYVKALEVLRREMIYRA